MCLFLILDTREKHFFGLGNHGANHGLDKKTDCNFISRLFDDKLESYLEGLKHGRSIRLLSHVTLICDSMMDQTTWLIFFIKIPLKKTHALLVGLPEN
jgi:hypothetical protein